MFEPKLEAKKNKCALCKLSRCLQEASKHPSVTSIQAAQGVARRIIDREPKALRSISECPEHNTPLRLNVCMVQYFKDLQVILDLWEKHRGLPKDMLTPQASQV